MKKTAVRKSRQPSLQATIREAKRGIEALHRVIDELDPSSPDTPVRLLALAKEHNRLWNEHAARLGLPLLPDPDAPEDDDP